MYNNESKIAKFFKVLFIVILCIAVVSSIVYALYSFVPAVHNALNIAWNWVLNILKIPNTIE